MIGRTPVSHGWIPMTPALRPARPHRVPLVSILLLGVVGATLGCSDRSLTGPGPSNHELVVASQPRSAVTCAPMPGDTVTVSIGPAGGKIAIGRHVLAVPKDALSQTVAITAVVVPDTVNVVQFAPEGLAFAKAAILTMYDGNCPTPKAGPRPRIALVSDDRQFLDYVQPPPGKGPKPPFIAGNLVHFSNYAVAW